VPARGADLDSPLLRELIEALNTGDQPGFERFAQEHYSTAALAETPVDEQADALARIYVETGGLVIDRVVAEREGWVQSEVHDRIGAVRYCATLRRAREDGRELATGFSLKGLYPAGAALTDPAPREVVQTIDTLAVRYARRGDFSGVVLLAKDDKVILHRAYGSASLAYDRPVTLNTRLNIASIGKSITGTAIAQLVEAGRVSYDDVVGKFLPNYPEAGVRERATVRQLLSHTSGLGPEDYYQLPGWAAARPNLRSVERYVSLVGDTPLGAKPGEYLYSNSGYVLLGAIVESVTGQNFYDYVQHQIFERAGMTRAFYHEMDAEDRDVATPLTNLFPKGEGYVFQLGRPRSAVYELPARGGPQGGAYLTASDLFAFVRALRSGKLIGADALALMMTAQGREGAGAPGLAGEVREGLGLEVITQNGHRLYGHTGGDLGVASLMYWFPDTGYTTIVLSNRDPRAARVIANVSRTLLTRRTIGDADPPPQACVPPAD
jgi:CubicO group peptidase (beta-lactamase class C family)